MDEPAALSAILELNDAAGPGKESVVFSPPDVCAGTESSSSLPNQNRAAFDLLSPEGLDAQSLGMTVPPVSGAALPFLVCHG